MALVRRDGFGLNAESKRWAGCRKILKMVLDNHAMY